MKTRTNINGSYGYQNMKMDAEVYTLRRKVMKHVYTAKNLLNGKLPRIDVRVIDGGQGVNGIAKLGANVIFIPRNKLHSLTKLPDRLLERVVLHEIVHAVTGFEHDDSCPLMTGQGCTTSKLTIEQQRALFISYFK